MPDFPAYTRDELVQRARDIIRGLLRGADVAEGADYDIKSRILGTLAFSMQQHAGVVLRNVDPRKAFGVFLREYIDIQGIGETLLETSAAARKASGKAIIRSATGTQTQLSGSALTHADAAAYALTANATTNATAVKTLRSGHRSGRKRVNQGHVGGGFVAAVAGEVYQFSPTSEYVALYDADNGGDSMQHTFLLYNELDADPAMHSQFVQQFGAVASIEAAVAGRAGNKDAKDTLLITSPSGTIQATAYILSLTGGRDALTTAQMQAAIRDLQGTRLGAMTLEELRLLAMTYPTTQLRECFLFPGKRGIGTYELLPVGEEGPLVATADRNALVTFMADRTSPVDHFFSAAIAEVKDTLATLEVRVAANMAPDWMLPDSGATPLAVAGGSTTTQVNVATTGMEVGDRVIIACVQAADPFVPYIVQRRIAAIGGTPHIEVDEALPYPPVAAESFVTPGGPLGQAIIDALYAYYDDQSPSGIITAPSRYYRYPAPGTSENVQALIGRVTAVPDVLDAHGYYPAAPTLAYNEVVVPAAIAIKMWG